MVAEWYKEQPKNRNFLVPAGFRLDLELFPGVDFFCQGASIPDISMPIVEVDTPYRRVPIAGSGGVQFGDLNLTFIIDEDLVNYTTIHNWIRKFGLAEKRLLPGESDQYSLANLFILSSHNNINHIISFINMFPVSLSGVPFDATIGDVEYLTANATFKYESFEIRDENFKKL